jgi:glycosylphosphatidylinositol deacylase
LSGIPILFAPGNSGSYEQVRSIATTILKHMFQHNQDAYFDVFTIDYSEEHSGLYGPVLVQQTEFMHESIKAIRQYYSYLSPKQYQLILIAHSIGGLICKGLFTLADFDRQSIAALITLSTPHLKPVVPFDSETALFYYETNLWWSQHRNDPSIAQLPFISIHGGTADRLVASHLSQLSAFPSFHSANFELLTTAIPNVWVQADHVCIIWCNQLNKKLVNMLRDLVNPKNGLLKANLDVRLTIIRYHLLESNQGELFPKQIALPALVLPSKLTKVEIIQVAQRFHSMSRNYLYSPLYLTYSIKPNSIIVVVASGITRNDWLFGCHDAQNETEDERLCDQSKNLSPHARLVPTLDLNGKKAYGKGIHSKSILRTDANRRLFVMEANELLNQHFEHLIVYLNSHQKPFSVMYERFTHTRQPQLTLPSLVYSVITFFTYSQIFKVPVSEDSIYYSLQIPALQSIWSVYKVKLVVASCYEQASEPAYVHKHVPWYAEDEYFHLEPRKDSEVQFYLQLHVAKPSGIAASVRLNLLMDPQCSYELSTRFAPFETIVQIGKHHMYQLLPSLAAILLSTFAVQMQAKRWSKLTSFEECKQTVGCLPKYLSATQVMIHMPLQVSLYGLVPFVTLLLAHLLRAVKSLYRIDSLDYIENTFHMEHVSFVQNLLQQTVLYSIAYSLLFLVCLAVESLVKLVAKLFVKLPELSGNRLIVHTISALVCIVLLILSYWSCRIVAFALLVLIQLAQTVFLCARGRRVEQRRGLNCDSTLWNLHVTVCTLLLLAFVPTLPAGIVWILKANKHNFVDGDCNTFLALIVSIGILWQQTHPRPNDR